MKKERIGILLLLVATGICIIVLLISKPIIQNLEYHNFSDSNAIFTITNFWNVISNFSFVYIGIWGYFKIKSKNKGIQYLVFTLGIILVGLGSGYYHYIPNNQTLIWDRLPMTVVFMSLFSIVITEFISVNLGKKSFVPLIILGILSIIYWVVTKDLRVYAFVQFFPILAIVIILFFFKSKYRNTIPYWLLLIAYVIAKLFEYFDEEVHIWLVFISGHTLKHLISTFGLYIILKEYLKVNQTH